jgi:hypothetical protein
MRILPEMTVPPAPGRIVAVRRLWKEFR